MNKTVVALAGIVAFTILAVVFLEKKDDKKEVQPPENTTTPATVVAKKPVAPTPANPVMELSANKKFDVGGALVRSFFKNWEYSRYDAMHAQTVNSRNEGFFALCLKQTPISWRNLNIISEKRVGDDWDVDLSVEVTDLTSAFAGIIVNTMVPPGNNSDHIFRFSPKSLNIEHFMNVRQTWHVVTLEGKNMIDIMAKTERHSNIMNYVLDTGVITNPPPRGESGWTENQQRAVSTYWLAEAIGDTNTPQENVEKIMLGAKPLIKVGIDKVTEFAENLHRIRAAGQADEAPEGITFQ